MADSQVNIIANIITKVDNAEKGINKLKNGLSKLKIPDGIDKGLTKSFTNLEGIFERYRNQVSKGFKTKGDVSAFSKVGKELDAEMTKVSKYMSDLTGKTIDFKVNSEPIKQLEKDLTKLIERQQELTKTALSFKIGGVNGKEDNSIESLLKGIRKEAGDTKAGRAANAALANLQMGDIDGAKAKIDEIIASYKKLGQAKKDAEVAGSGMNILGAANAIKSQIDPATKGLQEVKTQADAAVDSLNKLRGDQMGKAANEASKLAKQMEQNATATNQANKAAQEYAQSSLRMTEQLNQLKSSTQYFFGLRNMLNLLKQGFRDALETVKELDAAMTETAVVTKFDVGDMWEKLPEYTANANALGATIQDMYKSATLYYQQGLNAQQAMGIASETMKMARIGGLEAADATDMMTAALRGFNMELSNTSAQRINDVYSNLAAKTASNTRELGEAMERTASIANSAGMSFEGTSAFLAQMIETTREAPENLGTAMKTIIARFQELKKNPLEMQEVDGEEVSFNKVDAALQTIGVSLKDANGQFRELDQVFLDIASRWDGLSQTQQRFIATTAAGSRQQSRFIAMMNNYDRTVQLMSYANDSAGASNEQFGKTMEGLEAKLNKLKNAWDLFTMGLASNDMIKGAVDGLTKFVNGVTSLIDTLSFGSSKLKSVLTIFTAFTGLRMAGKGINALLGGLGGMLDPTSSILKGAFGGGLLGSRQGNAAAQAKMINQPIVSVLNQILGAVRTGKTGATDTGIRANYKQALSNFRSSANKSNATISGTLGTLKGLDAQQVRLISKSNVGTMRQLQRSMAQSDMGNILAAQMVTAMKRGNISGNQVAGLSKANIGKILGTQEAQAYSESFSKNVLPKMQQSIQRANENAQAQWASGIKDQSKAAAFMNEDVNKLLMKKTQDKDGNWVDNPLYNKEFAQYAKKNRKEIEEANKQQAALGDNILKQKTPLEKFQNGLSHIGGAAISAGQGLMSLGATLNSMGFEAAGAAVSSFGSALSNLGMIANGIPAMLSLLSNPVGLAVTAMGGAVAVLAYKYQKHIKQIKESAEEVTNSFKETQEETTANITNLKTWKEEMATLSKGVDENGLNINLSDVDYAHYLEIVDAIAKINPEIVKGYNAQGHAIIDNNKALEDTLKQEEKIQKQAQKTYIQPESLQALIDARNLQDSAFYKNTHTGSKTTEFMGGGEGTVEIDTRKTITPMAGDVGNLLQKLKDQEDLDIESILKTYNINLKELESGQQQAVNQFVKFQDKINSDVSKAVGTDLDEAITDGFNKLSDNTAAFEEAIQPVLQNLQTYASSLPGFDNIGSEFQAAINTGLKDIAIQPDLDATQMQDQAQVLIQEFDNLTRTGGEYATAMEDVEDAQNQFASSLDASEYAKNTEDALNSLNLLLKQYEGNTTAYGQAVSEYLTNQIDKIKKFTEKGSISLTEALNTATAEIAAAEGAYQAFQDATKTDMATGAENMKSIFDEITKETDGVKLHMEGDGDNTLWTGMSSLFSEEAVEKAAKKGPEAVQNMLNRIKPMLQDGQKGFDAFWTDMFSDRNYAKLKDIEGVMMDQENWDIHWDDDLNPDVFHEMAEALGYSDEFLTSMLNKGRQFGNIDFMDMSDVRKALSTDENAIKGTSTSTITNDEGKQEVVTNLFVKKDYLKNALTDAGIINPADQKKAIDNITKNGVKIIPGPKDISEESFKQMGISDIPSLIKTLGDTGQFDRSEIAEYAKQMGELGIDTYTEGGFDTLYKDYLDSQEHPELPTINSIDSNVQTIASILGSNRVAEGYADESTIQAYEAAKKAVNGENGHNKGEADSISELFALGKNKDGVALSDSEYNETLKQLNKQIDSYTRASQEAEAGAEKAKAEGRDADAKELLKEAHGYAELAKRLTEDTNKGEQVHENLQNAEESTKQKAPGMTSDVNQILDKQKQAAKEQIAVDKAKSDALAKQTEEANKKKEEAAAVDKARSDALVKQTEETNKKKEKQAEKQKEIEEYELKRRQERQSKEKELEKSRTYAEEALLKKRKEAYKKLPEKEKEKEAISKNLNQTKNFGSTDLNHRQELYWPKEISDYNKNWKAAQQWGWSKKDLAGTKSTFMSDVLSFDEGTPQEMAIAFTPMLQGKDGKPEVLTPEAVNQYTKDLMSKARTANGELDTTTLMNLDKEGNGGKGLFMGLFEGPGAIASASALGETEHAIEEAKLRTSEVLSGSTEIIKNLDSTAKNVGEGAKKESFVIDERYAAYAGQAQGATYEKVKEGAIKLGTFITEGFNSLTQAENSIPNQETSFVTKVATSAKKLGEALKKGWDSLTNSNIPEGNGKQVGITVNKGASTVQSVAQQAVQNTQSQMNIEVKGTEKLDEAKTKGSEAASVINKGAKFTISTPGMGKLNKAATNAKKISDSAGSKTISLNASIGGSSSKDIDTVKKSVSNFEKLNKSHSVKLKTSLTGASVSSIDAAVAAINRFHQKTDHTVTLKTIKKTENKGGNSDGDGSATGTHNHGYASAPPNVGSAARGSYGQLGPKGKGGMTLTGELGYEIAWLPSENRSMILGANGPQMVNLPGDAVVWTHEQSKKIMRQKSIPAGSHSGEARYVPSGSSTSSQQSSGNPSRTRHKTTKKTKKSETREAITAGKISSKIFNLEQKIAEVKIKQEKAQKALNKQLAIAYNTMANIQKSGNEDIKRLKQSAKWNKNLVDIYNNQLKKLDRSGDGKTKIEWTNPTEKRTKKKGKWGKWKKDSTKKHTASIDLGNYIYYDKDTDAYLVDYGKINKTFGSDKNKAKAVKEAAEKQISDKISKRDSAQKDLDDANEKLEELGKTLYENFYSWKNELTEILEITKQIENAQKRTELFKSMLDLDEAMTSNFMSLGNSLQYFQAQINSTITEIDTRADAINMQRKSVLSAISNSEERKELKAVNTKIGEGGLSETELAAMKARKQELEEQLKIQEAAQKYVFAKINADGTTDVNINENQLNADRDAGNISKELYEGIKNYYDTIIEENNNLIGLYEDQVSAFTNLQESLRGLKEDYADKSEKLLEAAEESAEDEIEQFEKLNSSLTEALKELLDGVKEKLDERRNKEDNEKTERDISKQQQRLAMLRADTSGGHQVEIAQLERDIADSQQSYQRTLEDQLLDRMQAQADKAEKQRERQIALMNSQLEIAKTTNSFVDLINQYLADPERYATQIEALWKKAEDYENRTDARKAVLDGELASFQKALDKNAGLPAQIDLTSTAIKNTATELELLQEAISNTAEEINDNGVNFANGGGSNAGSSNGGSKTYTLNTGVNTRAAINDLKERGADNSQIKDALKTAYGSGVTAVKNLVANQYSTSEIKSFTDSNQRKEYYKSVLNDAQSNKKTSLAEIEKIQTAASMAGYGARTFLYDFAKTDGITWEQILKVLKGKWSKYRLALSFNNKSFKAAYNKVFSSDAVKNKQGKVTKTAYEHNLDIAKNKKYKPYAYESGGLATQTGPAWLDGTPSKPELVLNAQDTKNFMALKDVLSHAVGTTNQVENSYGGNATYEININVDHLNNDYDVDRVVERVKKKIVQDSGYRNVTQVRKFR